MNIPKEQIDVSKIIGYTKEGKPVVLVTTKGGLNAIFTINDNKEIISLSAAPHRAIALFLAQQRDPDIKLTDESLNKSQTLQDKEAKVFIELRNMVWSKVLQKGEIKYQNSFLLYDIIKSSIQIIEKNELIELIKNEQVTGNEVIRELTLSEPAKVLFMHDIFKKNNRIKYGF